ncbi:phage tail protein [Mycobacterium paragordonae]|uniref:Phage tail protein n=1 Tax=Mycobacterium paragordonae TaxID=1389713 RepID=A0AAJ1W1F3_9MYCO|nr:phage tail protein [Mycobacterium paragordonae]MDP7733641.1 phage tail protein [Mycobacterium paragordonae]
MALIDDAVITAALGYIFTAAVGTAAPSPAELDAADPEKFGSLTVNVKVTGSPTSYTLVVGGTPTAALPLASTADTVRAAIEAVAGIGVGNVEVSGVGAGDTDGLDITFLGALQGTAVTLAEGTYVGGTAPDTTITTVTALNGWHNIGHTSRDDLPEFGFDGGKFALKGTWQRKRLKQVQDGDIPADFVTFMLEQWDRTALELYFGEDAAANTPGVFGVDGKFIPVERALLIIIVDGDVNIGFYCPKASITRDDSIELPIDEFASLPVKATFLNLGTRRLYDWISELLFPAAS